MTSGLESNSIKLEASAKACSSGHNSLRACCCRGYADIAGMEPHEWHLLLAFAAVIAAKLVQQAALLCAPVRVPTRDTASKSAVAAARDAAEWALYAKDGKPPSCKRLGVTLGLLAAVAACLPVWWKLTEARRTRAAPSATA